MAREPKKPDIWMPLYVGDYLRKTARLQTLGHGAYLLLLMDCWVNGPVPDDDDVLAAVTKLPTKDWKRLRPSIEPHFSLLDGKWHHARVDEEKKSAAELSEKRRKAGKEGADKRWQDDGKEIANAMANGMANEQQNDRPSPSPSPVKEPVAKATGKKTTMPTGFDLTPERRAYAQQQRISDVEREWSKFIDYCLSNRKLYADWDAAWRNWCRSPYQQPAQNRSGGNGQRSGSPGSGSLAGAMRAVLAAGGEPGLRAGGVSGGQAFDAGTTSAYPDPFAELDAAFGSPVRHPGSHALPVIDQEPSQG